VKRQPEDVMSQTPAPSPADLALLAQVIHAVTRNHRLSDADAQDFAQTVQLRLLQRNYEVFHRFTGRSSLRTYLVVVVTRLLIDWRNSMLGKWRPSAAAARHGPHAISLERLVLRDGHTIEQAIEVIRGADSGATVSHLRDLAAKLPWRQRPRLLPADALLEEWSTVFVDPVEAENTQRIAHRIREALSSALRHLSTEERRMVVLRYGHGWPVQALARRFRTDPKLLYRRFERVLRALRAEMQANGVAGVATLEGNLLKRAGRQH
jgi:RNA polymerase sigma factor (sigma-70 family)